MAKTIYCSFCGSSNLDAGPMMETTDRADERNMIRICEECATLAIEVIVAEKVRLGLE
jgi:hypothetical protein